MDLFSATLLSSLTGLLIWKLVQRPANYPPGPRGLPMLGVAPQLALKTWGKSAHESFAYLAEKYGPIVGMYAGPIPLVVVNGYETSKLVLHSADLSGRPDAFTFRVRALGKRLGILFNDGEDWHTQRTFALRHLRDLGLGKTSFEFLIHEEIQSVLDTLKRNEMGFKNPVSLKDMLSISVLNVLWAIVAGQRYDQDDERLEHLLHLVQRVLRKGRNLIQVFPFLRHVAPNLSGYEEIKSRIGALRAFIEEMVQEHEEAFAELSSPKDFVDIYLEKIQQSTGDPKFNRDELIVICLDLFEAGSETTTSTLETAFLYMLHYPEVLRKAQDHLDQVVGRAGALPSLSHKQSLGYIDAILCEVMRIAGVTPLTIPHRAMNDTNVLGYTIPKDAMILVNLWSIHHDPALWEDPHLFKPERFLDQNGLLSKPDYFLPFGSGRRACLGESLARNTLFLYFSSLIHQFDLAVDGELPDLEPQYGVTLTPKPYKVHLTSRF